MYSKRLRRTILVGLLSSLLAISQLAAAAGAPVESEPAASEPAASESAAGESTASIPAAGESAAGVPDQQQTAVASAPDEPAAGEPVAGTPEVTASGETTDAKSKTGPPKAKKVSRRRAAVSRNFRPSEDITADNSVAYPVDI